MFKDRLTEARACLEKGKLNINASRNTKGEIKLAVRTSLERLYQLVKESEKERKAKETSSEQQMSAPKTAELDSTFSVGNRDPSLPTLSAQSEMVELIKKNTELLEEISKKLEKIQIDIEKQRESLERTTYASVVAQSRPGTSEPERTALHSVVISSEIEQETGEQILEKVRKAVDAKEGWIRVERVRKAKDRKIVLGCKTQEERRKIKERLELAGAQLVVEEVKNKNPLIVLRDVLLIHSDEDVLRALQNQNRDIFCGLDDKECKMEVKYRRRARNPLTGHIVLCVSPKVWKRATEEGRVRVDLQSIRVEDQSPLVQCTRCLGYGHGRRLCKEPADLCSHCSGPHLRADCPERLAGEPPVCKNCTAVKIKKCDHNAFSSECTVRRRWDGLARESVAYC
jgi:hypothetical protein